MTRRLSPLLVAGLAAALIAGCGESGSTTSTVSLPATGAASGGKTSTAGPIGAARATGGTAAAGAADASATTGGASTKSASSNGSWDSGRCNTALIAWYHGHGGRRSEAEHVYKQTLRRRHGCFTASSLEPTVTSTGAWNTAQCNAAVISWYKSNRGSSAQAAQAYRQTLRSQHGCFTATSLTPIPAASAQSPWNSAQCNDAVISWYKSNKGASPQAAQAYRHTLRSEHGCFTASSVLP